MLSSFYNRWPILETEFAGNSLLLALTAFATFLVLLGVFNAVVPLGLRYAKKIAAKSSMTADDEIVAIMESIPRKMLSLLALLMGIAVLNLPGMINNILQAMIFIIITSIIISVLQKVIELALVHNVPTLRSGNEDQLPTVLRVTLMLVLWSVGLLMILSNLGINVVSLIAGLGIGGIAIALALQNILSDMFSSFALFMDKPFREGDFIVVGANKGVVKKIGLKTTRLQALEGEELVISNQELTSARVQNFKRMHDRRVSFAIGVTYDATSDQLKKVPEIIKKIIEGKENVRFDRAHFKSYGDSSLDFEIVYYVLTAEYGTYMDLQQVINLEIYEQLQEAGLDFAFPTRTVHLVKDL